MPKKTKIILISTFLIVLLSSIGIYLWINRNTTNTDGTQPWYQSFNPFGTGSNSNTNTNNVTVDENGEIVNSDGEIINSKFHQITDFAISGAGFFEEEKIVAENSTTPGTQIVLPNPIVKNQTEKVPSIRYVEKKNGHIYKMLLDTKIKEKVSNGTIPGTYEAILGGGGKTVIYRYLSEENLINSFITTIGAASGEFLPQNISDFSISPEKNKFFYLTENDNSVTGTVGLIGDTKRNIVFNHPFTEWLSEWDNKENIYLTTKASFGVPGSIFILNSINKTISKIFGGVEGLTTKISPDGSLILYSYATSTGPKLGVFNIKEHSTTDFNLYGLSEKCVWSKDSLHIYCGVPNNIVGYQYPDYWYQGLVSFDDFFVKINITTGENETIANSTDGIAVDAISPFTDKEENSLFFTNKKDSTLWSLDLK